MFYCQVQSHLNKYYLYILSWAFYLEVSLAGGIKYIMNSYTSFTIKKTSLQDKIKKSIGRIIKSS